MLTQPLFLLGLLPLVMFEHLHDHQSCKRQTSMVKKVMMRNCLQ